VRKITLQELEHFPSVKTNITTQHVTTYPLFCLRCHPIRRRVEFPWLDQTITIQIRLTLIYIKHSFLLYQKQQIHIHA